jgi:hypothetical protein
VVVVKGGDDAGCGEEVSKEAGWGVVVVKGGDDAGCGKEVSKDAGWGVVVVSWREVWGGVARKSVGGRVCC